MSLLVLPNNIDRNYVVEVYDAESGKETVKLISCRKFGEATGLKGKELNRSYDALKSTFHAAGRTVAHSMIDRAKGLVSLGQSKTRYMITLERPKNTAADLRRQAQALLDQAAEAEASENTMTA